MPICPFLFFLSSSQLEQPEPKYSKPPTLDKVRKQIGDIGSKWF